MFSFDWPRTDGHATAADKLATVRHALQATGYRLLVETGMYAGYGTGQGCLDLVDRYVVVDCQLPNIDAALAFRDVCQVTALLGDSGEILPEIVPLLQRQPAVFWLDAHKIEGDNFPDFPTLRELAAIAASPLPHVVLVDDIDQMDSGDPDHLVGAPEPQQFRDQVAAFGRWEIVQPDSIMRLIPLT